MSFIYTREKCGTSEVESMLSFDSDESMLLFISEDLPQEDEERDQTAIIEETQ